MPNRITSNKKQNLKKIAKTTNNQPAPSIETPAIKPALVASKKPNIKKVIAPKKTKKIQPKNVTKKTSARVEKNQLNNVSENASLQQSAAEQHIKAQQEAQQQQLEISKELMSEKSTYRLLYLGLRQSMHSPKLYAQYNERIDMEMVRNAAAGLSTGNQLSAKMIQYMAESNVEASAGNLEYFRVLFENLREDVLPWLGENMGKLDFFRKIELRDKSYEEKIAALREDEEENEDDILGTDKEIIEENEEFKRSLQDVSTTPEKTVDDTNRSHDTENAPSSDLFGEPLNGSTMSIESIGNVATSNANSAKLYIQAMSSTLNDIQNKLRQNGMQQDNIASIDLYPVVNPNGAIVSFEAIATTKDNSKTTTISLPMTEALTLAFPIVPVEEVLMNLSMFQGNANAFANESNYLNMTSHGINPGQPPVYEMYKNTSQDPQWDEVLHATPTLTS